MLLVFHQQKNRISRIIRSGGRITRLNLALAINLICFPTKTFSLSSSQNLLQGFYLNTFSIFPDLPKTLKIVEYCVHKNTRTIWNETTKNLSFFFCLSSLYLFSYISLGFKTNGIIKYENEKNGLLCW